MSRGTPPDVLLDGAALSDGRAGAGIGRTVRELSDALMRLAPDRCDLVVPSGSPLSESRPGRHVHGERALLRAARRRRPRLVHGLGGEPLLGWPLSRQVVTVHDLELWNSPSSPRGWRGVGLNAYRHGLAAALRRCAAVVAVSDAVAADVAEQIGLSPSKVHTIGHGLGPGFTARLAPDDRARREGCGAPDRYLLWVGSQRHWDARKALDVLVAALATCARESIPPLVLAGARGEASDRVVELANRKNVAVHVAGAVDDATLAALYRGSAAVVVPSRHEGFGLPALEALACGAPLVCSDAGNLPSLAGPAAMITPAGDVQALAAALTRVLIDPDTASRVELGIQRSREHTWDRAARQTLALYGDLLIPDRSEH